MIPEKGFVYVHAHQEGRKEGRKEGEGEPLVA